MRSYLLSFDPPEKILTTKEYWEKFSQDYAYMDNYYRYYGEGKVVVNEDGVFIRLTSETDLKDGDSVHVGARNYQDYAADLLG